MTFPTIPTTAASRVLVTNQLNTTAARTFPNLSSLTKNSGDLLIAIVVAYQSSTTDAQFGSWGGGFAELHDSGTSTTLAMGVAYKWSDGTESGTFTVTQSATITGDASMILLSIPGAHASTPPEVGARVSGTTAAADPASFNPSGWDVEDTLWVSVVGSGMTAGTGSWTATGTAGPTNYTDRVDTNASDTSTTGDVEAAVSFRQLAAASEDVGTAGVDVSNARNGAVVIAIRPAPAATNYDGTAAPSGAASTTSAGIVGAVAAAAIAATCALTATGTVGTVADATVTGTAAVTSSGSTPTPGTYRTHGTYREHLTYRSQTPGGGAFTGTATATGTGAATSAGTVGTIAGATVPATCAVTSTGSVGKVAGATATGTASVTPAGVVGRSTGATATGAAAATSTGVVGASSGATVAATASVTSSGVVTSGASGSATVAGTVTITTTGAVGTYAAASIPATATATAAGAVGRTTTATVTGTAAVTSSGARGLTATGTVAATGAATASGAVGASIAGAVAGSGVVASTGTVGASAGSSITATATVAAAGALTLPAVDVTFLSVAERQRAVAIVAHCNQVTSRERQRTVIIEEIP